MSNVADATDEPTPEEQRAARAAYMRTYRNNNPERYQSHKRTQRVREHALRLLGRRHADELQDLIEQEIVREEP